MAHFCDEDQTPNQSVPHPAHDWVHHHGSRFHCPGQYVEHEAVIDTGTGLIIWHKGQRYTLTKAPV